MRGGGGSVLAGAIREKYLTGLYYGPAFGVLTTRTTANKNQYWMPHWVGESTTFQGMAASVTTAGDVAPATVNDAVTNGTAVVTSATMAFNALWVGRKVTGTNIPAGTYILSRDSATQITMSQAATGSGSGGALTVSGCVVRLGAYADNAGRPGALIVDVGTIDGGSNTSQGVAAAANFTLSPGLYWLSAAVLGVQTTSPILAGIQGAMPSVGITPASSIASSTPSGLLKVAIVTTWNLPDPADATAAFQNSAPAMYLQVA